MSGNEQRLVPIKPAGWKRPQGYSNGILATTGGRILFVAGQVGWDESHRLVGPGFVEQFERALQNVVTVVEAAGGRASDLGKLTLYVVDRREYLETTSEIGKVYRQKMGRHYPAMALVEVSSLLEPGARIEIEGTAVLPRI